MVFFSGEYGVSRLLGQNCTRVLLDVVSLVKSPPVCIRTLSVESLLTLRRIF